MSSSPQAPRNPSLWTDHDRAPDLPKGTLVGLVERVTFHSEESGYAVLKLATERGCVDEQGVSIDVGTVVSAVGTWTDPSQGVRVRLTGSWGKHPAHGLQFQFDLLEFLPPLGRAGIIKYLSSKAFKGIGAKLAARIVEVLGNDTLEIIRNEPERLGDVKGLKLKVQQELVEAVRSQMAAHRTKAFLLDCGLGPLQSELALKKLGTDCEKLVREDPYILARGIAGLGFVIADRVAVKLGFAPTCMERLRAGLHFALERASSDGHSLLEANALTDRVTELLGGSTDREDLGEALEEETRLGHLKIELDLREDERLVYLPRYHTSETALANNLVGLVQRKEVKALAKESELMLAEKEADIELHPEQRAAVLGLLSSAVGLLTGGPGVGKTTIVRLLVELAESSGARVLLASPTGRAAKRLSEATTREASTIHRMLGYDQDKQGFKHDADNPLKADLVIVDELSMLDLILAHHLVKAIEPPTRLILIGDPNQLPAVGAGAVLADLIDSEQLPVWRLTEIFRQQAGS
ncbi:MAG: exodeoxyribonuclease V alpha subunit, partial [Planctomycetota bacterium]